MRGLAGVTAAAAFLGYAALLTASGCYTSSGGDDTRGRADEYGRTPEETAGPYGLPDATCGNGLVEWGEACDDGNTISNDGCKADCSWIETCLDGAVEGDFTIATNEDIEFLAG